jgi:YjjG family noncanonical pyrimidine nucleotidase
MIHEIGGCFWCLKTSDLSPHGILQNMARYSWIMLDADGTLFDFDTAEESALARTLSEAGITADGEAHRRYRDISLRLWLEFEAGTITLDRLKVERFKRLMSELGHGADPHVLSRSYIQHLCGEAPLLPGAQAVVEDLAADHELVLATNGIAEVQRRRFEPSSIRPFFRHLIISEEIGAPKPQTEYFAHAFALMGEPRRSEVLMVGDSLSSDIAGGAAYGLETVWFNPQRRPLDGSTPPTHEIFELDQLRSLLE